MEEKKSKKPIIIGVAVTLLVTLTLLGVTYAYYRTRIIGNQNDTSISVTSKTLELTYDDNNSTISATGVAPGYSASKTFKVKNTGNTSASFAIIFDNVTNTFSRKSDWTYTLKRGTTFLSEDRIPGIDGYQIVSETIAAGVTNTYTLTINYKNVDNIDQSVDMGRTLSLRVNIENDETKWEVAEEGTLLYAIKNDNTIDAPLTSPGQEPSSEDEAVLFYTLDDFGTSYYFRGNVTNNYVNFSDMCWRIVRVQGDGNIKIVLADRNNECDSANYTASNTNAFIAEDTQLFAYHNDWVPGEDISYEISDISYVLNQWLYGGNYTYSTSDGSATFNTGTFTKEIDDTKLADAEWCDDMSIHSYDDEGPIFGAYGRLNNLSTASPSLECDFEGLDNSTAEVYIDKIGLLTADEVAFAGSTENANQTNSYSHYLQDNMYEESTWLITPYRIYNNYLDAYTFDAWDCSFYDGGDNQIHKPLRPAVVLKSDVTIEDGGTGTQTNPYVIS